MNYNEIIVKHQQSEFLIDEIKQREYCIDQLTNGVMSRLGNKLENKASIQEYNMQIVNLKAELEALWNNR